jgi:zinc protease
MFTLPPNSAQLRTLANGLEVIILEDHSHPLAAVQLWVKAGSLHEEKWTGAGLAHLVEHMFFKGTERRTAPDIAQEIQARGGYVNAYTTFNRTVYWIDGVAEHVDGYLDILSDMARRSTFHADELIKEQEVIRREFAMDNDDPQSVVQHLLQSTAFREHPLRHPIIGHLQIFNQVGRDDLLNFVHRHYVPNNCFLVIVGDVDTEKVLQQVEQHFGSWERRPYEPVMMPEEPTQVAPRRAEHEFNTDIVRLSMGWHIHGDTHPDKPALDVLGFVLGSGRSSRLNVELRERLGVAHWVGSGAWSALDRGVFALEAECDGDDLSKVETAIESVLKKFKGDGCTKDELDKAVNATLSGQLRLRSTTRGMASSLGHSWLAVGNLDYDQTFLQRISELTVGDVTGVANRYLSEATLSRVSLHPTGTLKKISKNGSGVKREEAQRFVLSNGLTLLVGENPRLPLVSMRAQFLAGVPVETFANAGATQVAAQMLLKGTATRTDEQIGSLLEDRGGTVTANGDVHRFFAGAEVKKGDEAIAMELLGDLLISPSFPEAHLKKIKKRQLAAIREEMEDPLTVALRCARRDIFATLPYERTAMGTLETVEKLSVEDCRSIWKQSVTAGNGIISVFGDVKADEMRALVERHLASLPQGTRSTAGFEPLMPTASPVRRELTLDKEQGVLVLGFPTVGLKDPNVPALNLIDEACSDMGSRLFNHIREKMGLAYYVGAQAFHALGAGAFYFYVGCDPKKLDLVEEELLKQIADLAANGLESAEFQRAKTTWKSSWLRQQQGNGAMADALGWDELNGFGFGHHAKLPQILESVTEAQVKEVAAKFFQPERAFTVRVKP